MDLTHENAVVVDIRHQIMTKISSSPDRHTFQRDHYIKRVLEKGKSLDDPKHQAVIEMYDRWMVLDEEQLRDAEWQKNNMEFDLRSSDWIVAKVRASRVYAQNLYAAMCNNDFQKFDVCAILKDERWSCSWRYAGGIVADMRGEGDYVDWYCSGIRNTKSVEPDEWDTWSPKQQTQYKESESFVGEGMITDEIKSDLKQLGWFFREGDHDQI